MKRAWNYLLTEPFSWLFNYLLYPFDVNNQVEKNRASERVVPMLRLALPMFTFSFLSALIIRVPLFLCSLVNDLSFLLFIGLAVALSTVGGIIGGIADGIKLGLWSGIGIGIFMGVLGGLLDSTGGTIVGLIGLSLGLGVGLGSAGGTRRNSRKRRVITIIGWSFWRLLFYLFWSVFLASIGSFGGGAVGDLLESQGMDTKNGIIFGAAIGIAGGIMVGGLIGLPLGSSKGSEKSEAWRIKRNVTGKATGEFIRFMGQIIGIPLGIIICGLIASMIGGILGGFIGGILWVILGDNVKIIGEAVNAWLNSSNFYGIPGSTTTSTGFGILVGTALFTLLAIYICIDVVKNYFKMSRKYIREGTTKELLKTLIIEKIKIKQVAAISRATLIGLGGGILGGIAAYIASNLSIGIGLVGSFMIAIALFTSYYLGYLELILYPLRNLSINWAYRASSENPRDVFGYIYKSSLYWSKHLPLDPNILIKLLSIAVQQDTEQALQEVNFILNERPELISTDELVQLLRIVAKRDTEQALQEINFILNERPELISADGLAQLLHIVAQQDTEQALQEINYILDQKSEYLDAAQTVWLEITTRELEMCESLLDIAQLSREVSEILQEKSALIPFGWGTTFAFLDYASREAAHYCSPLPLSWRTRREALKEMIAYLKRADSSTSVVDKWLEIAQVELEELEKVAVDWIDNPYTAGPALELRNSLFVGRRDLVQQLEDALGRGRRRPSFFLHGERRMGKSSTLKQLPDMLAAHYLPIFYDLQVRGISSSIAAFLGTIAKEIYEITVSREIQIKNLEEERLKEAAGKNEATAYYVFDNWLRDVEHKLEQENRTLLLTFDEFEKLGEAGQAKFLDLNLLLDWFRSIIQNHPRLALLFSGVSNLEEMSIGTGINWAGYFVNVRRLKVSFLKPEEAFKLITKPEPNFPGEEIFGEEVIEEIMRVTGCHPFLVQAVCETLIDNLNVDKRDRTEMQDVTAAVNQVLTNWWDTYFRDLWVRTDQNQRICLITMSRLDISNLEEIAQQSKLDDKITRNTLLVLLERDLVMVENGNYRISTPIFTEWVKRNS